MHCMHTSEVLTNSRESDAKSGPLSNLAEDVRLAVPGDVMGDLEVAKGPWRREWRGGEG